MEIVSKMLTGLLWNARQLQALRTLTIVSPLKQHSIHIISTACQRPSFHNLKPLGHENTERNAQNTSSWTTKGCSLLYYKKQPGNAGSADTQRMRNPLVYRNHLPLDETPRMLTWLEWKGCITKPSFFYGWCSLCAAMVPRIYLVRQTMKPREIIDASSTSFLCV